MKQWASLLLAGQFLLPNMAVAHGPTPQKIDEKVVIAAPIDEVWQQVSDFGAIADWHPMVEKVEVPEAGTRVLTLKGKGNITESLDDMNADEHSMSYRLYEEDITVLPVSFYSVSIELEPVDAGTEMSWKGRFYRADTGNFPPEHYNDAAAVSAMTEFANSGMAALKQQLEGRK
ncbi:SRPBCC family protein [Methylophaga sp.]|jgi:hypothetical protein|uniref:SRPBCC family protein n=1 Tax=Methylophaga sp. TaxID=2024840 RepID=UPI0013FF9539|nr:SRPBCC family protein [Methylophaga sp.]MTI63568.1 SRPBCC family protein [Methylophaga sp.]